MKKLILLLFSCLPGILFAQTVGYLRNDTVKITNAAKTATLVLETASKGHGWYLKDVGNGRLQFVQAGITDIGHLQDSLNNLLHLTGYPSQTLNGNLTTTGFVVANAGMAVTDGFGVNVFQGTNSAFHSKDGFKVTTPTGFTTFEKNRINFSDNGAGFTQYFQGAPDLTSNSVINLPKGSGTLAFAGQVGSGYILDQDTASQTGSKFWMDGFGRSNSGFLVGDMSSETYTAMVGIPGGIVSSWNTGGGLVESAYLTIGATLKHTNTDGTYATANYSERQIHLGAKKYADASEVYLFDLKSDTTGLGNVIAGQKTTFKDTLRSTRIPIDSFDVVNKIYVDSISRSLADTAGYVRLISNPAIADQAGFAKTQGFITGNYPGGNYSFFSQDNFYQQGTVGNIAIPNGAGVIASDHANQFSTEYQYNGFHSNYLSETVFKLDIDTSNLGNIITGHKTIFKDTLRSTQVPINDYDVTNKIYVDNAIGGASYQPTSEKGATNGYAGLDASGKVPLNQINDALLGAVNYRGNYNASTNSPALPTAASANKGYYWIVSTEGTQQGLVLKIGDWIISNGSAYGKVDNNNSIASVFGRVGTITATTGDYTAAQVTNAVDATSSYSNPSFITSLDWSKIANPPTTLTGYGITDAYTKTAADARYLQLSGGTMTGDLTIGGSIVPVSAGGSSLGTISKNLAVVRSFQYISDGSSLIMDNRNAAGVMSWQINSTQMMRMYSNGAVQLQTGGTFANDGINRLQVGGNVKAAQYRLSALNTAPTSSTDTGTLGEIRVVADYIYVCTATNTWVRTALTTF